MVRRTLFGSCGRPVWLSVLAALVALAVSAAPCLAADIVRVEEDWELVVASPDPGSDAPQVTCMFSPVGNIQSAHAALELNQRSAPSFASGGVQLQLWNGEALVTHKEGANTAVMATADESVRWTQVMEVSGGVLKFSVVNGQSTTWGSFGGEDLKLQAPTTLTSLNAYNPAVSLQNSAVGYASNRVKSLVLKRIRFVLSTGEVLEDPTVRVLHALD